MENKTNKYSCLVLSGGHIKGIYMLGSLHYLQIMGYLDNISIYCGTSVGSLISYFLILGYTPANILMYLSCNKIEHENMNLLSLIKKIGLYNFNIINTHLEILTLNKLQFIPTLKQLYDITKKKLICVTYNQTIQKTLYISHETHPNLSVLIALQMSSNMPFVFEEFTYNGNVYVDGGITDNFAIKHMDQLLDLNHNILGIEIDFSNTKNIDENKSDLSNFLSNLFSILNIPLIELYKLKKLNCSNRTKIITLETEDNSYFNFDLNVKTNIKYFSSGYRQTKIIYEGSDNETEFEKEFKKYKND